MGRRGLQPRAGPHRRATLFREEDRVHGPDEDDHAILRLAMRQQQVHLHLQRGVRQNELTVHRPDVQQDPWSVQEASAGAALCTPPGGRDLQ